MKKLLSFIIIITVLMMTLTGCLSRAAEEAKIPVKVLILPKFEVGELSGDFPGEAQYYYENYLADGEEYGLSGYAENTKLYYKDGVALCVVGQGKISAAINTSAVLSDQRFDFSEAYVISTGCAGSAKGYGIMGDVFIISAVIDYDLGHHADPREMTGDPDTTWFHDESYDDIAVIRTDPALTTRVYDKVKDLRLETTELTAEYMRNSFPGEEWADRQPKVLLGTSVTSDNFWKGQYNHNNALLMTETYGCADPYAVTEMEDIAVGRVLKSRGMLDRFIIIRDSVNVDVFTPGVTPESLWGESSDDHIASEDSEESVDIFAAAMRNNYTVGSIIIDAVLNGEIR